MLYLVLSLVLLQAYLLRNAKCKTIYLMFNSELEEKFPVQDPLATLSTQLVA
jgi:hypothetical protein